MFVRRLTGNLKLVSGHPCDVFRVLFDICQDEVSDVLTSFAIAGHL
jgi:hypothetical protein